MANIAFTQFFVLNARCVKQAVEADGDAEPGEQVEDQRR